MRYIAVRRPRMAWDEWSPMLEAKTVMEPEPVDTGLVDRDENVIYRVMAPIGFVELKERS
jgi:hypothetical protein